MNYWRPFLSFREVLKKQKKDLYKLMSGKRTPRSMQVWSLCIAWPCWIGQLSQARTFALFQNRRVKKRIGVCESSNHNFAVTYGTLSNFYHTSAIKSRKVHQTNVMVTWWDFSSTREIWMHIASITVASLICGSIPKGRHKYSDRRCHNSSG